MRTSQILIRVSEQEKQAMTIVARDAGKPVSSWARQALVEQVAVQGENFQLRPDPVFPKVSPGGQLLSLFCGPGGLDLGFKWAGFDTAIAIDIDSDCVATFNRNNPGQKAYQKDIRTLSLESLEELHGGELKPVGVIGGPPCQSFSYSNVHQTADDPRHSLPSVYARLLKEINKKRGIGFFVFENVLGLLSRKHIDKFKKFEKEFAAAGFIVKAVQLDAVDFGVPQVRPRVFIVGINKEIHENTIWTPPLPVTNKHETVKMAIGGLPEPFFNNQRDGLSVPCHPNHYCMVPRSSKFENGNMQPGTVKGRCFRVLSWDDPSWTVAYGNREVHIHPNGKRRLSMFEALRLQSFPDSYVLTGNLTAQVRLVSEAVPPLMAYHIASSIRSSLGI